MAIVGPLLRHVLDRIDKAGPDGAPAMMAYLEASLGASVAEGQLPIVVQLGRVTPRKGEEWEAYKHRLDKRLSGTNDMIAGGRAQPLYLANALSANLGQVQVKALADSDKIQRIELDPVVYPTLLDDSVPDIGAPDFIASNKGATGKGVRVAVLDSGVDELHPFLHVHTSVSTCGEAVSMPGSHGTHCAGVIASQDAVFGGVAKGAELLNVKVLRANGSGTPTYVTQGIDKAMDLGADILSMSLGFNHLPPWSDRGMGWNCPGGACQLCDAVNNATRFGKLVVVAAGNEHQRAETLRRNGHAGAFDTELGCPGHAREALTVGAITKRAPPPNTPPYLIAAFSSHGPTAYGLNKPDIAAPGVNVTSTIPVPRLPGGAPDPTPARADLFGRKSGTSMAAPLVAGAAALLIEALRAAGKPHGPATLKSLLLTKGAQTLGLPAVIGGGGRIDMRLLGVV